MYRDSGACSPGPKSQIMNFRCRRNACRSLLQRPVAITTETSAQSLLPAPA